MNETAVLIIVLSILGIICSYCKKENDKMNDDIKKSSLNKKEFEKFVSSMQQDSEALKSFTAAMEDENTEKIMRDFYK